MARDRQQPPTNVAWTWAERLFRAGSPEFVDAVRKVTDAKQLAVFAETWYTDTRIEARRLLNGYLEQPFNALRHEPLVKRLFKFADNAGDDATMARFLVGFDRTVRRRMTTRREWNYRTRDWNEQQVITTPSHTDLPRDDRFVVGPWFQQNRERFTEGRFL